MLWNMSEPQLFHHSSLVMEPSSFGSVQSGKVVHANSHHVAMSDNVANSCFVHDKTQEVCTEIARENVEIDLSDFSSTMSFGVLRESSSTQTIQPIISTRSDSSTFSCVESDHNVHNLTLDGGISWDRDTACLYLSSNKAFRFRFAESDGLSSSSRLCLEGLDPETGVYVPKVEFTKDWILVYFQNGKVVSNLVIGACHFGLIVVRYNVKVRFL